MHAMTDNPDTTAQAKRVDVEELVELQKNFPDLQLVDVRQPGETAGGTIEGAIVIPLTRLAEKVGSLDRSRPTAIYCAGGFRSSIAASILRANGFDGYVSDLLGGYGAWTQAHATA